MGDDSVTAMPLEDVVINHHFDEYDQSIKIYFTNKFVQHRHIMTFHKRKNKLKFTKFPDHDIPKFDRSLCQLLSEAFDPMAPPGTKLLLQEKVYLMFLLETLKVMEKLRDTNVFFTSFIDAMTQLRNEIMANQISAAFVQHHNSTNENVKIEESCITRVKTEPQQKVKMFLEIKDDCEDGEFEVVEIRPEVIVLSEDEDEDVKQATTSVKTGSMDLNAGTSQSATQPTFPKSETRTVSIPEPSRTGQFSSTFLSSNSNASTSHPDLPDI